MATIVLKRPGEGMNLLRSYLVYIDHKIAGTIANGETREFVVPPGTHSIVAKIDWCSSNTLTFEVSEEGVREFKVSSFGMAKWILPLALWLIVLAVVSKFLDLFDGFMPAIIVSLIILPAFLLLVYFLTIGRKRYLVLKENTVAEV